MRTAGDRLILEACRRTTGSRRVVLERTHSLLAACRAAVEEHNRGALGSTVVLILNGKKYDSDRNQQPEVTAEELEVINALGFVPHSEEIQAAHDATWRDDRYSYAEHSLRTHTEHLLIKARDAEHYHAMVIEEARSRRGH